MSSRARCFQVHASDNVATLLDDAAAGATVALLGGDRTFTTREPIAVGHKIALCDIAADQPVVKFNVPIGRATRDIAAGDWVHLHNCASNVDVRSGTLDLHTGSATDTKYE